MTNSAITKIIKLIIIIYFDTDIASYFFIKLEWVHNRETLNISIPFLSGIFQTTLLQILLRKCNATTHFITYTKFVNITFNFSI